MSETEALTVETLVNDYPLLGPEQISWIANGDVDVSPGKNPQKPVLRWASGNAQGRRAGALAPGGGAGINHKGAENGRKGAIKNTAEYLALAQRILSPEDAGGMEEVLQATRDSAVGTTKHTKVDCPECGHRFTAELKAPGDPRSQKILIELMIGGPVRRSEIDINMKSLQIDLSELVELDASQLADLFRKPLSPEEVQARRDVIDIDVEELA